MEDTKTMSETTEWEWRNAMSDPPPEGQVVQVFNNEGAKLKRIGGLWFLPDGSMYVYYTPEWWRPLTEATADV